MTDTESLPRASGKSTLKTKMKWLFSQTTKKELQKAVITAAVTAIGGYLAALLISPEQLYRWVWLRGSDSYMGVWIGQLGDRYAELHITSEELQANGRTVLIRGFLVWRSGEHKQTLSIFGAADSSVTLTANLDPKNDLNISLHRVQGSPRAPDERMVQLLPREKEQPAKICPVTKDPIDLVNMEDCSTLTGKTYFKF